MSGLGYRNQNGGLERVRRYLDGVSAVPHRVARTPEEVAAALDSFREEGVQLVVVNGGDGTLSMVLTCLLAEPPATPLPMLSVLAGGRTNMSAGDVGLRGDQVRRLRRLLAWARSGEDPPHLVRRPALRVERGGEDGARHGMFVGAAAVYDASVSTWTFRDESRLPGMRTGLGTAVNVVRLLGAHLLGRRSFAPTRIRVRLDGEPMDEQDYCVIMITTLERMALGLFPFWGDAPGSLHVTLIAHRHRHLLKAGLGGGLWGRPNRYCTPKNGYVSRRVETVELELGSGATLDGEVVEVGSESLLRVSAAPTVTFVKP